MKRFNYDIKLQFVLKTLSMSILGICLFAGILILDKFGIKKVSINSVLIVGTIYILPSLLLFTEYLLLSSKSVAGVPTRHCTSATQVIDCQ